MFLIENKLISQQTSLTFSKILSASFWTNADLESHALPFFSDKQSSPRDKAIATLESLRESLPSDANIEDDEDKLRRKAERALAVRRELFYSKRKDKDEAFKKWRETRFCDIRRSKRGRPSSRITSEDAEKAELLQTVRHLIEDYSARCSMEKVDVLSAVVADCHDSWKTDGSK